MSDDGKAAKFTSSQRKNLFLELASRDEGVTPRDVYTAAKKLGDAVTEEAYYNIGRRLAHQGLLRADGTGASKRFFGRTPGEAKWLDEEDLSDLFHPDYPLPAIAIVEESTRQMREISDAVWRELRMRLSEQPAQKLFADAIRSYCNDFNDLIGELESSSVEEHSRLEREADQAHTLLEQLTKFGLGLSREAVSLPVNLEEAVTLHRGGTPAASLDDEILQTELARRVSDEMVIVDADLSDPDQPRLIGGVDGSTRTGLMSFVGLEGDSVLGNAPHVSVNTSVGQINRELQIGKRSRVMFTRLPERPEDMQRGDNQFTVMAKFLYPELTDGKYMHSVWNAMDLVEARITLRLLGSWSVPESGDEVPGADVVMRDGTVSPQERDFPNYCLIDTFGRIARRAIETNWSIAQATSSNEQTVAGVVKHAQRSFFVSIINWFACQLADEGNSVFSDWPLRKMNLLTDQTLMTHLLAAGRKATDGWIRTCVVVRPFHALTTYGLPYCRRNTPSCVIMDQFQHAKEHPEYLSPQQRYFWTNLFHPKRDAYKRMMDHVSYANLYIGCVLPVDAPTKLPRLEIIVNDSNREIDDRNWETVHAHVDRLLSALKQNGFEVANEHNLYGKGVKLDLSPSLLIRVHDTVKLWSADLFSRVREFVGALLTRHVGPQRIKEAGAIRPFTRDELELLHESMQKERDVLSGGDSQVDDEFDDIAEDNENP